jgi:hypothetical protein
MKKWGGGIFIYRYDDFTLGLNLFDFTGVKIDYSTSKEEKKQ